MAEWLYERGIGEARAALVEDGAIFEAHIEPDDAGPLVGAVAAARLIDTAGRVRLVDGAEALLDRTPAGLTKGAALTVRITREPLTEAGGRAKPARCTATDELPREGPDLLARLPLPRRKPGPKAPGDDLHRPGPRLAPGRGSGEPPAIHHLAPHGPDLLEQAGWSELLEEARTGDIAFPGGSLRMWPTPAMTLFDVDGGGSPEALAVAAAHAVAGAIRRHGIGGSIGIDLPTLSGKAARQAVADALDAALLPPFERTAMNGFGFLQIVRPRPRASLPERLRADPAGVAARALLRRLEREPPGSPTAHRVTPAILAHLDRHPDCLHELQRRTGRRFILSP